uniref:hypothetical protein n=1 Tax=Herbidospora sakaeratensis TaxID=564415 RepID=UPI00078021FF|nr:hypothetical protein [Herbidospora sakaeratensis]
MAEVSRAPAIVDALVALAEGLALDDCVVYDGPSLDSATRQRVICVGWDGGDSDSESQAIESTSDWAGIGIRARDEQLVITGAVIAWEGAGTVKTVRDEAYAMAGALELALRADPSLGFPSPTVAAFRTVGLFQAQDKQGPLARLVWQIAVSTRI